MKHTKGPWVINDEARPIIRAWNIKDKESYDIADLTCDETGNALENAHLIAAAPEMLEALEELNAWNKQGRDPYNRNFAFDLLDKAIRKAKGGA